MKKLKKLLLSGLTFVLTLGMLFQATPAFAQGVQTVLPPGHPQIVPAQIKSMTVLEIYPPQLTITGTLPSPCYQVHVSTQVVSSSNPAVGKVFIWVRGVAPSGTLCVRGTQPFTTTVTLNPAQLGLAPGKYLAIVNQVNGRSAFKLALTVPTPRLETVSANITNLTVLESYPPQFKVSGTLPSGCSTLRVSAPQVKGRLIFVFLDGVKPTAAPCSMAVKPFSTTITIDPARLKLARGTSYTVVFNPVYDVSRFKAQVFVGLD